MLVAAAACAPQASVELISTLAVEPPACLPAGPREDPFLLDIGADAEAANGLTVALLAILTIDNATEAFLFVAEEARTFFSLAEGTLQLFETPRSAATARSTTMSGSVSSAGPSRPFFVTIVTSEDAVAFQKEAALAGTLTSVASRVRFDAHVQVRGVAVGVGGDDNVVEEVLSTGLNAVSQTFVVPFDVCIGCLTPTCAAGTTPDRQGCFRGVDIPAVCEPD